MTEQITNDDVVLDILLTLRNEQQAPVTERLIREIYDLQKRHQFEPERSKIILSVKRAVEAEVDEQDGE